MMQHFVHPTYEQVLYPLPRPPALPGKSEVDLVMDFAGYFHSKGGFSFEQRSSHLYPHIITGGAGEFIIDGRRFEATAGDIVVFFPRQHIFYRDLMSDPWRYVYLNLSGLQAENLLGIAGLSPRSPYAKLTDEIGMFSFLSSLRQELELESAGPLFGVSAAWRFIDILCKRSRTGARDPNLLKRCLLLIHNHYSSWPDISSLAENLGVSRTTIFRVFKKELGCSPLDYLLKHKLAHAEGLLAETDLPVASCALRSGFGDASYFSRIFRLHTGLSPQQWKQEKRLSAPASSPSS
ncbi:MAG: helix-turn-helix domain-containing protein [Planctomycetes bacterium]|nr:helix-turn-helix domain-containing protein [Planctomycetota bacterium]